MGQCSGNMTLRMITPNNTQLQKGSLGFGAGYPSNCNGVSSVGSWTNTNYDIDLGYWTDYATYGSGTYSMVFYDWETQYAYASFPFDVDVNAHTISQHSLITNGVCGSDNLQQLTSAPTNLCNSGTAGTVYWNPIEQEWLWSCNGSGGGTNQSCYAHLSSATAMDGVCGSANGQTVSSVDINDKCSAGLPDTNTYTTLTGFTWFCWGINGGQNVACSATNSTPETYPTPPDTSPVPTPTDCSTETGLNQIVCNITNTIEGMFLPSQSKLNEFQDTINSVNEIFPFSYLSVIGNLFKGSTVTDGTLTMTLLGNTASLSNDFFNMPLFADVKLFMTIMVLLMFTFWAINYIKHFFK